MAAGKKKIYRNLDFPPDLYQRISDNAEAHQHTFEDHVVFLLSVGLKKMSKRTTKDKRMG